MSIFNISISGLLASQASIQTTSHNIANANVEGYSRQTASQETRNPNFLAGNYFGTGVEVSQVKRIFEASHQLAVQANTADFSRFDTFLSHASRVDNLLVENGGVTEVIQKYFSALQGVVNDPASISARQVMLSEAETMVSRFDLIHSQLENQVSEVNQSIKSNAEEITELAQSIARLNNQISSSPGDQPPDLLDQRDIAITRLSELVGVQTIEETDGSYNVFIGTGQSLVVGSIANQLTTNVAPNNPRYLTLNLSTGGSSSVDITDRITGGKLGALIEVTDEIINPAFNVLGKVALGIADSFNAQHQLGLDLNNELGGNFFIDINESGIAEARVINSTNNTGSAEFSLTVDDPSQLKDSNYRLFLSGGNYQLVDTTNNTNIATFAPPGIVPATVQVASEGFTINFESGAAVDGDVFEIQPTRNFSRDFESLVSQPEKIAAASPIRAEQSNTNIGSGRIASTQVTDTTTGVFTTTPGSLTPPIRIEFDATPGEFSVFDMTTGTPVLLAGGISGFVANQENNILQLAGAPYNAYGYEVTISGDPQSGDSFDINFNNNGAGDNTNVSSLGELQFSATLDNGNSNFQQAFGRAISDIGVKTQSAKIKREASESLLFQSKERKSSVSGVNLDEEAANLIRFQQAYQASAQAISVARNTFQTVIDAFR